MSSDLLYSLGLDITDFKTSAKASKEAADDIKQGFKGFKDVLAAGGVTTAVLGFFSSVIDYAQQAKGPIDENTAAVRRFGQALDEGKKTTLSWGVQALGTLNQTGERIALMFDKWINGETKALVLAAETLASTKASAEAHEALLAAEPRRQKIAAQRLELEKEFEQIALAGLSKQEAYVVYSQKLQIAEEALNKLKKGSLEYQEQELVVSKAKNDVDKADLELRKMNGEVSKKAAEEEEKALDQSIKDYNKLGDIKAKQLAYEQSKKPLEEQSAELARQKLALETSLLNTNLSLTDETELRTRLLEVDRSLTDVTLKLSEARLKVEKGITAEKQQQTLTVSTGEDTRNLTDAQLAELRLKTARQLSAARQQVPNYAGSDNGAGFIENRLRQIDEEAQTRSRFRNDYAAKGENAFKDYSAFDENRLRSYISTEDQNRARKQAEATINIDENLRRLLGRG